MKRLVLNGIELVIARDGPLLGAGHIELEDRGQEMPGVDQLVKFAIVERDRRGGIAAPVDHAWNTACTAHAAGGPLACPFARGGREGFRSGHSGVLEIAMLTLCAHASRCAGRDATRLIAARPRACNVFTRRLATLLGIPANSGLARNRIWNDSPLTAQGGRDFEI